MGFVFQHSPFFADAYSHVLTKNSILSEAYISSLQTTSVGRETVSKGVCSPFGTIDGFESKSFGQMLPSTTITQPISSTALFSGFPYRNPPSTNTRTDKSTTTMLRLSTNLRIPPKKKVNPFSSIVPATLRPHRPRNVHEDVRAIKKKATLSSLMLLANMLYDEERVNTSRSVRSTFTHRERHRTRLSESCTFEFERREHREMEGEIESNILETVSGVGVGDFTTIGDEVGTKTGFEAIDEIEAIKKNNAEKAKIVELYSKSSDAGDKAFASLLEINMVELSPEPENDIALNTKAYIDESGSISSSLEEDFFQGILKGDDVAFLLDEIDEAITKEAVIAEDKVQPQGNMMTNDINEMIDLYSKSSDADERAFATLLARNNRVEHDGSSNELLGP